MYGDRRHAESEGKAFATKPLCGTAGAERKWRGRAESRSRWLRKRPKHLVIVYWLGIGPGLLQ